ncbi:MAG TPA: class I SAM-dependent rRNA methyltransferase [Acidimicrobiaceae bacterium]|nr:class I SAM-dependent rRNA methyltransferase [Acidimicrobiaceae bacterium]
MEPAGTHAAPLAAVPDPEDKRVAVRVTPDALRHIRGGHPWVFDRSITSASHEAPPGALAVVFDDRRRFAAIGLWDPTSPLRIRILHAGDPETVDVGFWGSRLAQAEERRRALVEDGSTTGFRWVNGESDGLPGLIVDRYGTTAVVKVYSAAWLPHLPALVPLVADGLERVVLRLSRAVADGPTHDLVDGQVLVGAAPEGPVEFLEHGLTFGADVVHGQKTGHFLDQRDNRTLVGSLAAGRDVLDVFACTGGFSVHAAAGGARSVHTVDLSEPAIATSAANMARNRHLANVAACDHTTEVGDAFRVLERHAAADRRWDVVVIDPPSFAPRQDAVGRALKAYARLTALGLAVTRRGGLLVQSSCSSRIDADTFHRQLRDVARRQGHGLEEVARTTHPIDHPATFPEAWYLKTAFVRVDPRP